MTTTIHAIPAFPISPRRKLLPGRLFKTLRGSGPTSGGDSIGVFGTFVSLRIYSVGERTYVEAIGELSGRRHDLFVDGPAYVSPAGSRERPYRIKLLRHDPARIARLLQHATHVLQRRKPR